MNVCVCVFPKILLKLQNLKADNDADDEETGTNGGSINRISRHRDQLSISYEPWYLARTCS